VKELTIPQLQKKFQKKVRLITSSPFTHITYQFHKQLCAVFDPEDVSIRFIPSGHPIMYIEDSCYIGLKAIQEEIEKLIHQK